MIDADVYRRFEDRFRGTREEVKLKLQVYAPLLAALEASGVERNGVDYGCGRGEWLDLLTSRGWSMTGVDINDAMVRDLAERGVDIVIQDALEHIRGLPAHSIGLVSGFHIAEHLSPEVLVTLIGEAHRVLVPSGMLILETPNPENLLVGSNRFYMDPTHIRPIPPEYFNYIGKQAGFAACAVVGLPAFDPDSSDRSLAATFQQCLDLPNDYALLAQTAALANESSTLCFANITRSTILMDLDITHVSEKALPNRIARMHLCMLGSRLLNRRVII
jgi:O-antigen chain-terminating methyltransferase